MAARKSTSRTTAKKAASKNGTAAQVEMTMDQILDRKRPMREEVPIAIDYLAIQAHEQALARLTSAQTRLDANPDSPWAKEAHDKAQAEADELGKIADENRVIFLIEACGAQTADRVLLEHPPTEEQIEEYEAELVAQGKNPKSQQLRHNAETYPPAMMALCITSPKTTIAQAEKIWAGELFSQGEVGRIWSTILQVNRMLIG